MIRLLSVVLLALTVSFVPSHAFAEDAPVSPLQLGREAPWIAAFDAKDEPVSLAALARTKGKRGVVTQFWASWCEPCVRELEEIAEAKEKFDDAGITVFLVNLQFSESGDGAEKLVKRLKLDRFPLAFDRTGAVARAVGLSSDDGGPLKLPLTMAVNSAREIKLVLRQAPKDYVDRMIAALEKETPRP